jgi:hypothetical protein
LEPPEARRRFLPKTQVATFIQMLGVFRLSDVGSVPSFFGEFLGNGPANALVCSGYQGDLALQS